MPATVGDRDARRRPFWSAARVRGPLFVVLALTLLGALTFLAGCKIDMALDTVVEPDGSGTVGVRLAADKEIQDLIAQQGGGEGDLFADFESGVPEGWESDSGTDPDGTRWVTASRSFSDLAEIQTFLQEGGDQGPAESVGAREFSLTQESGLLSVKTVFSAAWDMQDALAGTGENAPPGVTPDTLASIFVVQNRLTLPGSIKDNNADEVQGNTLIWRPSLSGTTEMNATSVAYKWPVIAGIAAVIVLLVAAAIAVVVLAARRRGAGGIQPTQAPWQSAGPDVTGIPTSLPPSAAPPAAPAETQGGGADGGREQPPQA